MDFGYVGRVFDPKTGKARKAWVFLMVLGFSRHMFARVVFDQKIETWLRLRIVDLILADATTSARRRRERVTEWTDPWATSRARANGQAVGGAEARITSRRCS